MAHSIGCGVVVAALAAACGRQDPRHDSTAQQRARSQSSASASVCAHPPGGIIVSLDSFAYFPTRAPLSELKRLCSLGEDTLYDDVGWQGVAWVFPFAGARLVAVQSNHGYGESLRADEPADLWTAEGDSIRLPDGQLVPRTLGALRARYGRTLVDDDVRGGDDYDGVHAWSCRFPYISFALAVADTGRAPDSARIGPLEIWVPRRDKTELLCSAQGPRPDTAR